jgi:hypothetical protein
VKQLPIAALMCVLVACSSNVPPPNAIRARYEPAAGVVQVLASNIRPMSDAELIGPDGSHYRAGGIVLVSGPHVLYNPPPSIGIGIGGFGWTGCCTGIGSGLDLGFPVGSPRPAEVSDQFLTSATIQVPPDYAKDWMKYRVRAQFGENAMVLTAPSPPR